jgi:hypothetical protein
VPQTSLASPQRACAQTQGSLIRSSRPSSHRRHQCCPEWKAGAASECRCSCASRSTPVRASSCRSISSRSSMTCCRGCTVNHKAYTSDPGRQRQCGGRPRTRPASALRPTLRSSTWFFRDGVVAGAKTGRIQPLLYSRRGGRAPARSGAQAAPTREGRHRRAWREL